MRREPVDPVGFATTAEQMDHLLRRIGTAAGGARTDAPGWRAAIVPHDDYTYVGELYPAVLDGVRARTVILVGVAHKARQLALEDVLLFDDFETWRAPYGDIPVSPIREAILSRLPEGIARVHHEMHTIEHSLEALFPFLQHRRRDLEIVPILVPAMSLERMTAVARPLARAIAAAMHERSLAWGSDVAIAISSDAVHYGDEEWGGRDFALGHLVDPIDYREYRWTWCGRYSVPCGLLTTLELARALDESIPTGELVAYGTSVDERGHLDVTNIGLGVTAPAHLRHWVGYASVGFR